MLSYVPTVHSKQLSTSETIEDLKFHNTDFEWYPTTDTMIMAVLADVKTANDASYTSVKAVMDIGAGDGRVLRAFKEAEGLSINRLLGVEKSPNHVARWGDSISFVGGDFYECLVDDGKIDVAFSNPPYGEYENWTVHLLNSVSATATYLVLPKRWIDSERIQAAIKKRGLVAKIIMSDDFSKADRRARATVDVIRLVSNNFSSKDYADTKSIFKQQGDAEYTFGRFGVNDPMESWFNEAFPNLSNLDSATASNTEKSRDQRTFDIFKTTNTIDDLVKLYQRDADEVLKNYKILDSLDAVLFIELNIDIKTIKETLKHRMDALRVDYWKAFIHNYKPITERLTDHYRDKIFGRVILHAHNISFNATNALIITQMVINIANEYSNDQVVDFFYELSNPKSVRLYKSNQKVFSGQNWRYCKDKADRPSHYSLDYRIVQHRLFKVSSHYSGKLNNYEVVSAMSDVCIIARLVGMRVPSFVNGSAFDNGDIVYGNRMSLNYHDGSQQKTLFDIKFFMNGNQHLFLNKEFALRLNIYIGKLLGWVMNADEAFAEMGSQEPNKAEFNKIYDDTSVNQITMSNSNIAGYLNAS